MTLLEHRPSNLHENNAFPRVYQFYCCHSGPWLSTRAILLTFSLLFPPVLSHAHIPMHNLSILILTFLLQSYRCSELSVQKNQKYGRRLLTGNEIALALLNLVFSKGDFWLLNRQQLVFQVPGVSQHSATCFVRTTSPTGCHALLGQYFSPIFFPDKDYLILGKKTHIRAPGPEKLTSEEKN